MNRRQAKKRQKKQDKEYLEYLASFDEDSKWCILNKCPYYDFIGIYGDGCVNHTNNCPAESEETE